MEECCSLACSPRLAQLPFLYIPGPPAQGWHCLQWARPSPINHPTKKMLYIFSFEVPIPRKLKLVSSWQKQNKNPKTNKQKTRQNYLLFPQALWAGVSNKLPTGTHPVPVVIRREELPIWLRRPCHDLNRRCSTQALC